MAAEFKLCERRAEGGGVSGSCCDGNAASLGGELAEKCVLRACTDEPDAGDALLYCLFQVCDGCGMRSC